jgi:RHS repeat-associated protein
VIQDCRAPRVVSARRAGDVFSVVFDEPVAPATVPGALTLEGSLGALPGTVAVAPDATSATFTAAGSLGAGVFRLSVSTAVRDHAGNPLAFPFTQLFGGGDAPSFLVGTVLDDATGRPLAGARVIVVASDGVPLAEPRPEQTTGADGRFQLPVAVGTHDLTVGRPGYTPVFRSVTTRAGQGTDVFDPRLTPTAPATTLGAAGGTHTAGAVTLVLPAGSLSANAAVAATELSEQGLPALLPYGWTPRGALWLALPELAGPAAARIPVEAADGETLVVAELELTTLQWRSRGTVQAVRGQVEVTVQRGGALALVEADTGVTAPAGPVVTGQVLPSAPHPVGGEVTAAEITFDPGVVLPTQVSQATVGYELASSPPSGLPLTLVIEERLDLLDGTVRREAPYRADLVLYRAPDGAERSRFRLRASEAAARVPLALGTEGVAVVAYGGETVRGDVVGPNGGTVTSAEGDAVELPAGAFSEPVAVTLTRRPATDLPLPVPAGAELLGVLALDLWGRRAAVTLALEWAASPAPAANERGLVLHLLDLGQGPFLRPVAALAAGGAGWRTVSLDATDLPWPGLDSGGLFALVRLTGPTGYFRGRVFDVGGSSLPGAPVTATGLGWRQISDDLGRYVLPAPVGQTTVSAAHPASGNAVDVVSAVTADDERVDLDLPLVIRGPALVSSSPPDGAADLPPGINPLLTFSEPVAEAFLAGGIELVRDDGEVVPVHFETAGVLVTVIPDVTLTPGGAYELRVGPGVRDLAGNQLTSPVTIHFSVLRILLNADLDPTRIFTTAPNAAGFARVRGLAGAVPAHATLYVENTTNVVSTTTIQAGQDGSFELDAEAAIQDELLLHVLGTNGEDVVLPLTPFRNADFSGAYLGPAGGRFQTPAGIVVTVPPGAFDRFTLIKVVPQNVTSVPVPAPGFTAGYAFRLDTGGATAKKGLRVSVPAPPGADPNATYLLSRSIQFFGEAKWQLDDLGVYRNGRLTTEDEAFASAAPSSGPSPARMRAAGPGLESAALAAAAGPRQFLPGMWSPKRDSLHVFWSYVEAVGYLTMPVSPSANFGFDFGDWAYAVAVDSALARILPEKVAVPTRLGTPFPLRVRDLSTGATLHEGEIAAPAEGDQIVTLPRDTFDREPPFPVAGSPLRFYPIAVGADEEKEIAPGIHIRYQGDELTIRGDAGSTHPGAQVRLHGTPWAIESAGVDDEDPGSFEIIESGLATGVRYTLVIGAEVSSEVPLEIAFNEALAEGFPGIAVWSLGENPRAVALDLRPVGSREVVAIVPELDWIAGETYELRLEEGLADDYGNEWDEDLRIEFKVQRARVLPGFSPIGVGRDIARLGSLLFVAAHDRGIAVLDAANPAALSGKPAANPFYPWVLGAAVRGVAIDPHGRLFSTGGGDGNAPGMLRVYDPLRLDFSALEAAPENSELRSAWFMGSTLITNSVSGSFNLPPGTPRKMAILSNDDRHEWIAGDAVPGGLAVVPYPPDPAAPEPIPVTLSGTGARPHMPVTVRNQTSGRMKRVDADAAGAFQLEIPIESGDRLEVLINRDTVIYTAVAGGGIAVVDGNAVYQERALGPNQTASDVLNFFQGGPAAGGINAAAVIDLGLLVDPENAYPLVVPWVGLNAGYTAMFAPAILPSAIQVLTTDSAVGGGRLTGLEVLPKFRFDDNRDGKLDTADPERDYLVLAATDEGVLIYDVTNRSSLVRVARIPVPGQVATVGVDRDLRRVYAAAYAGGVYVIDLPLVLVDRLVDADGNGTDDRVLETIEPGGTSRQVVLTVPELGVLYVGGDGPGTKAIANGGPRLTAVVRDTEKGGWREIRRLAPFGVPTYYSDPDKTGPTESDPEAETSPPLPGAFRVLADLPGHLGPTVELDLVALGAGGKEMFGAGDPARFTDLPRTSLTGPRALRLQRLSDTPTDTGFHRYLSEEVAVLADLRASRKYSRTADEGEAPVCFRCDLDDPVERVHPQARELLSGYRLALHFPAELRGRLAALYDALRLDAAEIEIASVPWEMSPAVRQEPAQGPSTGQGEAVPGTLLHSGEFSRTDTDLRVKGLGFDFAFERTYRNQTVGAGPLGPGWSHIYDQHLRELPNGDLEYYDGRGRRDLFVHTKNLPGFAAEGDDETQYVPATGYFVEIERTAAGWVMKDAPRRIRRFDRFGRLLALADPLFTEATDDSGTALRFEYDATGRLIKVFAHDREIKLAYDDQGRLIRLEDHAEREVEYAYDADGRLETVTSPAVTVGPSTFPDGLVTRYHYDAPSGALAGRLNQRDNLTGITDAKGRKWLALSYTDADADGRADEVTTQTWGGDALTLAYQFAEAGTETTITDRRGHASTYGHNAAGQAVRHEDAAGFVTTIENDDEGLATEITSPRGRVVRRELDDDEHNRRARGNVQREIVTPGEGGPNGSPAQLMTVLEHDDNEDLGTNKLTLATDARGFSSRQELDPAGLPLTITEAEGSAVAAVTRISYNAHGQQTRVTNPNGHATTFEYFDEPGKKGYLKSVTVGGLLTTRYEVDSRGNVTAETDPRGVRHEYVYNELDWLVEERVATTGASDGAPALAYVTTYAYDANGNLTEETASVSEAGGTASTRTTYDLLNRPTRIEHAIVPTGGTEVEEREYDEGSNLKKITGANGQVTELEYDERNLVVEKRSGLGADRVTETFEYNGDRLLELRTDGRGHAWRTVYDGYGRPKEEHDPNGNFTRTSYDANGNPTRIESFDASEVRLAATTIVYDELNRIVSESRWLSDGQSDREVVSSRTYDAAGNVLSETDPLGRVTTHAYDAAERRTATTDPAGNHAAWTLDGQGNVTRTITTELGETSATVTETARFDALGRTIESTDGAGNVSRFAYDAHGNVVREIDPEGHLTTHAWDSRGRELQLSRPGGITMARTFDPSGRLKTMTDALGNTTSWTYDSRDRLTSTTYADGTSEAFEYDAADNVVRHTDPRGVVVSSVYDPGNRLTQRAASLPVGVAGTTLEIFDYDGLDRVRVAVSGGHTTLYTYDTLGRLTEERTDGRGVLYQFDDADSRTGMTYPSGAHVVLTPDALGRPSAITQTTGDGGVTYGYRGQSLVARKTLGAVTGTFQYDGARRPTRIEFAAGPLGALVGEEIAWSPRSLKTSSLRTDQNGRGERYTVDAAGRVTVVEGIQKEGAATRAGSRPGVPDRFEFRFDAAENLLAKKSAQACESDEVALPLDPAGRNRPLAVDATPLGWDAAGNLVRKGDLRLTYDFKNRLVKVARASGEEVATYEYDAADRRIERTVGGVVYGTVWAGWQAIEEYRAGLLHSRRTFGLGLDEIVHLETDLDGDGVLDSEYLPIYDSAGNLVLVTDRDGQPVERYAYSPFGERWIFVDSTPPRIEQVLAVGQEIRLELSEEADVERLRAALGTGITLRSQTTAAFFELAIDQPVTAGREAGRRLVLRTLGTGPAVGEPVELQLAPGLLADTFANRDEAGFSKTFPWPAGVGVLADETLPRVTELCIEPGGTLKLTFSETPNLAALAALAKVDGAAVPWTPGDDGYTVRSSAPLGAGSHTLSLSTAPLDLSGLGLVADFSRTFEVPAGGAGRLVFQAPFAGQVGESTILNTFGFHGLARDPETGFLYARNRYYDPELGRFVSTDPMGYADGPNLYQYALNNPAVYSDPMGLCVLGLRCRDLPGFYGDYLGGVLSDLGAMVVGVADLATLGAISEARAQLATFRNTEGSLSERLTAANRAGLDARLNTVSLGFYGAEDKSDHLKQLVGFAQLEQAGTLLGTAIGTGDWETGLAGVGKLLEGSGNFASTLLLGAGAATKAGLIPKPGMAATAAGRKPPVQKTRPPLAKPGEDLFVGTYAVSRRANLKSGLNPTHTPHHVVQDAVSSTKHSQGITINLRKSIHDLTATKGRPKRNLATLREHLAADIFELRKLLRTAGYDRAVINRQLQELVRQNKATGGFAK